VGIERATAARLYFATPHHAWERGTNENTNGLIRQYLPKRASMARLPQHDCNSILNRRPRKRRSGTSPRRNAMSADAQCCTSKLISGRLALHHSSGREGPELEGHPSPVNTDFVLRVNQPACAPTCAELPCAVSISSPSEGRTLRKRSP